MNGCFVLYPFKLGEALTKRINVGISTIVSDVNSLKMLFAWKTFRLMTCR